MSRTKAGSPAQGKTVKLPGWWLEEVNKRCGGATRAQIAERLTAATRRNPPFHHTAVGDFLRDKVTTDVMMGAFLMLFPDLPPPAIWANSLEEALILHKISRAYSQGPSPSGSEPPRVTETIEDTGEAKSNTAARTRTQPRIKKPSSRAR